MLMGRLMTRAEGRKASWAILGRKKKKHQRRGRKCGKDGEYLQRHSLHLWIPFPVALFLSASGKFTCNNRRRRFVCVYLRDRETRIYSSDRYTFFFFFFNVCEFIYEERVFGKDRHVQTSRPLNYVVLQFWLPLVEVDNRVSVIEEFSACNCFSFLLP